VLLVLIGLWDRYEQETAALNRRRHEPLILENISTWLVDWSLVTIMGNTMPPRDPNDDVDEDEGEEDEEDEDQDEELPVVREPDE
jgi:hypothetical protein